MKTRFGLTLAAALLVGSMGGALAADMSMPVKAPPLVAPTWTGFYLDAGVGYSVWNNDHNITGPIAAAIATTATTRDGGNGWLARFGGGYDWQLNGALSNWVIGVFGDYDAVSARGSNTPSEILPIRGIIQPLSANVTQNGTWYAGGRVGYIALPGLLTYVSAGATGTHFSQGNEFGTAFGASTNFRYPSWTNNNGWFVGGGTEFVLPWFKGLFLRSEYRYSSYGNRTLAETNTVTGVATGNVLNIKTIDQTVTTSLVWKFNWGGPIAAKY